MKKYAHICNKRETLFPDAFYAFQIIFFIFDFFFLFLGLGMPDPVYSSALTVNLRPLDITVYRII